PSVTPNLFQVTVTIRNLTGAPITDLRYRRVMDWDVEPTAFEEYVTVHTGGASDVLFTSDNGFATANPLDPAGSILFTGEATHSGPADHGADFDFGFGSLAAGGTEKFNTYYGAAGTESGALAALAGAGAEVYSLGQPSNFAPGDPGFGTPNTFV